MKNTYFLIPSLLLLTTACQSPENNTSDAKPFKHVFDFRSEAKRLDNAPNTAIIKTLRKEESTETIEIDSPKWEEKELLPFIESDFNSIKLQEKFKVDSTTLSLAGLKTYTYTALEDKLPVKKAEYIYKNGDLQSAFILKHIDNDFSNSEQILIYQPQVGFSVTSKQAVTLAFDESFRVESKFKVAPSEWIGTLDLNGVQMPLRFTWNQTSNGYNMQIINAAEEINVTDISQFEDSLLIQMPVFQTKFHVKIENDQMNGYLYDPSRSDTYKIPFSAHALTMEEKVSLSLSSTAPKNMNGRWETTFGENEKALGIFEQVGHKVYGTFATETGDYRFLEGTVNKDKFQLSTFDGAHVFLFEGTISNDKITEAKFYSGNHYQENWTAIQNESFELTHADSLTWIKEDAPKVAFTFPDLNGTPTSLSDEKYKDKVVMISIFGSWCPNCMDEIKYYNELYKKYNTEGLEIIGLAFERSKDFYKAQKAVLKVKNDLNVNYDFLIAGRADKKAAAEALPMLNHVLSFPTTIILDKKGDVVKVHTGFYGPGTGSYYEEFKTSTENLLDKLIAQ